MAKASKVNKSQMIRDYLAQHPDARPSEVAKAVSAFGVSPALAACVKARGEISAPTGRRKKRPIYMGARMPTYSQRRPRGKRRRLEPVLLANQLIRVCGGIEEAQAVLHEAAGLRRDRH
jgi:hypothetical protein